MAVLEVKKFNDRVLRKRCRKVKEIGQDIKNLAADMIETMEKEEGIGLAAPQVGELKRVIAVQTGFQDRSFLALVNPRILRKSREKEEGKEGCLSFPGIFLEIKRAGEIEVDGLDLNGKKIKIEAQGVLARVLQHEIDHLDGILFFDRLSLIKKIKFKLRLREQFS